jgi:hypothetical protein
MIFFQEKKYFLRRKAPADKPYLIRYVLEPWPADAQSGGACFTCDADAVAERDAAIKSGRFEDVARAFLYLFYPFLGLLWSGTKDKLSRFGIVPRTVTGVSIMVTLGVILLDGVFAKMLLISSMKTGVVAVGGIIRTFYGQDVWQLGLIGVPILWLDVSLFVAMVLDVIIRYSQHLRDVDSPWGFLEWLKRLAPRAKTPTVVESKQEATVPPGVPLPPVSPTESAAVVVATPASAAPGLIPGPRFDPSSPAGSDVARGPSTSLNPSDAAAAAPPTLIPGPRFERESPAGADEHQAA